MTRLSPPTRLTKWSLLWLSLLALWPLADLIYTIARYGTELTPDGAGYNFPPECCLPLYGLIAALGPYTLITRSRMAALTIVLLVGFMVALDILAILGFISDWLFSPYPLRWPELWYALGMMIALIPPGIFVSNWATTRKPIRKDITPY